MSRKGIRTVLKFIKFGNLDLIWIKIDSSKLTFPNPSKFRGFNPNIINVLPQDFGNLLGK